MDHGPRTRSSPQPARHALPGREHPDAALSLGDSGLPNADLYDLPAGQGGGAEYPQGLPVVPVYFWKICIRHKETRRKIDLEEYRQLPKEARKQYEVIPIIRYYSVFNLDQTDMQEKQPERYAALTVRAERKDYSDGMVCEPIDRMIEQQSWLCPIELRYGDRAYYTRLHDRVVCPLKEQFPKGEAFYGTLLHEIAHSTGHAERLNRTMGSSFGDEEYAREELVAELTSALCGAMAGFATTPREENAAYLKEWLTQLRREPAYLFDILVDVNRAARMIFDHLEPGSDEIADEETEVPAA